MKEETKIELLKIAKEISNSEWAYKNEEGNIVWSEKAHEAIEETYKKLSALITQN